MCTFFNDLLLLYTREVHGQDAGHTFYEPVRPDGAQNKTLILNTAEISCALIGHYRFSAESP